MSKSLFGKKVKFWFFEGIEKSTKYESTGTVTEYIPEEHCLTVKDDKDGCEYYVGADKIQEIKTDCSFWNEGCEFAGRKEIRCNCEGCLEYEQEKKIIIKPKMRKLLKRELDARMKIRRRKEEARRQHIYK